MGEQQAQRWWKVWKNDAVAYVNAPDRASAALEGERRLNVPHFTAEIIELTKEEFNGLFRSKSIFDDDEDGSYFRRVSDDYD